MASTCCRIVARTATASNRLASLKPATKTASSAPSSPRFALPTRSSPLRRFSTSRTPSELGCVQSLFPLHSAVASARMTSCLSASTGCTALSQVYMDGRNLKAESIHIPGWCIEGKEKPGYQSAPVCPLEGQLVSSVF